MTISSKDTEICPLCRLPLSEPSVVCSQCGGQYHQSCWDENAGCVNFGCVSTGPIETVPPEPQSTNGRLAPVSRETSQLTITEKTDFSDLTAVKGEEVAEDMAISVDAVDAAEVNTDTEVINEVGEQAKADISESADKRKTKRRGVTGVLLAVVGTTLMVSAMLGIYLYSKDQRQSNNQAVGKKSFRKRQSSTKQEIEKSRPSPEKPSIQVLDSYPINRPYLVVSDGNSIWVTSFDNNKLTKLRASDGKVQVEFEIRSPRGLIFDGDSIWVASMVDDKLIRLRRADGKVLGSFAIGEPDMIAFDGANIWVTSYGNNMLTKLSRSDGSVIGKFGVEKPEEIAFDGANIWVRNNRKLTKLRASDAQVLGSFDIGEITYIASDGANIWVTSVLENKLTKLRASDGEVLGSFRISNPRGVAFDGSNIWVASILDNKVTRLRASDGKVLDTYTINGPINMAFDGKNIWVASYEHNQVTKLEISPLHGDKRR